MSEDTILFDGIEFDIDVPKEWEFLPKCSSSNKEEFPKGIHKHIEDLCLPEIEDLYLLTFGNRVKGFVYTFLVTPDIKLVIEKDNIGDYVLESIGCYSSDFFKELAETKTAALDFICIGGSDVYIRSLISSFDIIDSFVRLDVGGALSIGGSHVIAMSLNMVDVIEATVDAPSLISIASTYYNAKLIMSVKHEYFIFRSDLSEFELTIKKPGFRSLGFDTYSEKILH